LHGVQVSRLGDEQGRAFFFTFFEVLGTGFNRGHFRISVRGVRLGFDHAHVVEIPCHRTRSAQLALAEGNADFSHRAVDVVCQALNDQRHLMGSKTFVGNTMVLHGLGTDTGAFIDRALDGVSRHRGFLGLLVDQAQVRVHVRVGAISGRNRQFLGQLAKNLAAAVGGVRFMFNLPLCAHCLLSQSGVSRPVGRRMGASLYGKKSAIDQKIQSVPA